MLLPLDYQSKMQFANLREIRKMRSLAFKANMILVCIEF